MAQNPVSKNPPPTQVLEGHRDQVTSLATSLQRPNILVSGSRDKSVLVWNLTPNEESFATPSRRYTGHSHFVSDVCMTGDGDFVLSGSWDRSMRLWKLEQGTEKPCIQRFVDHKHDVTSVSVSHDNLAFVSGSRDKTIKLWDTYGALQMTLEGNDAHSDWVSCVRFAPSDNAFVSCSHDKIVKVWKIAKGQVFIGNLKGHTGYLNTVTISPDGSLCASGGRDGKIHLWDIAHNSHLYCLTAGETIHSLCFSPIKYWVVASLDNCIQIWNLENKSIISTLTPEFNFTGEKATIPHCTSVAWSSDGNTLFAGYSDNKIRIWNLDGVTNTTQEET